MTRVHSVSRHLGAASVIITLIASVFLCTASAHADVRVWERAPETDEDGELTGTTRSDRHHAFVDVTSWGRLGFMGRFAGESSGDLHASEFRFDHLRLGVNARPFWWLRFRLDAQWNVTAGNRPGIADAFVDFTLHQSFNLRLGTFLIPFAYGNRYGLLVTGFIDRVTYIPNGDRPFLSPLSVREVGAMAHGLVGDTSANNRGSVLEYFVGMFNASRSVGEAFNTFSLMARAELHVLGLPRGHMTETDLERNEQVRPSIGFAAYSTCDGGAGNWNRGFTSDLELRYRGFFASASFLWLRNGSANGVGETLASSRCSGGAGGVTTDSVSRGAHVQLQYVLPRVLFPVDGQALELGMRLDWVDPQSPHDPESALFGGDSASPGYIPPAGLLDRTNAASRVRLTFGVNWYPTGQPTLKLMLNYQMRREIEASSEVRNDAMWLTVIAGI